MKEKYFAWALSLCLTMTAAGFSACSSDNDDDDSKSGIEKTYADDDFVMTERNIKEKLIGDWEIAELRKYDKKQGWLTFKGDDLGSNRLVKVRPDGSGELLGLEGAQWRVSKDSVVVSNLYLVGYAKQGSTVYSYYFALGTGEYGTSREEAEAAFKTATDFTVVTERRDRWRMRVKRMEKDYFALEEFDKSTPSSCVLRRK